MALVFALASCAVRYWLMRLRGPVTVEQKAGWMHMTGCAVLDAVGIQSTVQGTLPARGLLVANHLSYLDIAIFGALMPCTFVSKVEIKHWPAFGTMAQMGATIFVDRASRASATVVAAQVRDRLSYQAPVLVFPEGTSWDGSRVLRFHSTLFEPAVAVQAPVTPAAVRYVLHDGSLERDLCWFDDTGFVAHIWKALCAEGFSAQVIFGEPRTYSDRKAAARATHAEVTALRAELVGTRELETAGVV